MALTQVQGGMLAGSTNTTTTIQSNGTTAITIDSSQNVGIGTASPTGKLEVTGGQLRVTASSASSMFLVNPSTTYADGVDIQATYNGAGSFGPLKFTTSSTERMRVGADGVLCVGRTSASVSTNMVVDGNGGLTIERTSNGYRRMTMTSSIMYFFNGSNEATLSSSGAWTNASDARLKTNIEPIKYGLNTVLETQPRSFNRVDVEGDYIGFVAQELKEKIPEVVFGEEERQYSVDYGSLVAVAFKAIQELSASVDTLNAKVEAQAAEIAALKK
jgi:hypothetical protein